MTIFDLVTADAIATYWETLTQGRPPYLFETLFPAEKKLGLDLSYIKGASGLPVVLKTSAFDVKPIPRPRMGFEKMTAEMPFFKESMYIDEVLRQELNKVRESGNQAVVDTILNRIFADEVQLLDGARVARERMRAMAVMSGTVILADNGQEYVYDYGVPDDQKITEPNFSVSDFDIAKFINRLCDDVEAKRGERPTRMICARNVMDMIIGNERMAKNIYVLTNGVGTINQQAAVDYIRTQTKVSIEVYSKRYIDTDGVSKPYVPDNTFSLIPDGNLGKTWFGTTPEESDLMSGNSPASVRIVDTGVAFTTIKVPQPVQVEGIASMICLPSFEKANQTVIVDVTPKSQDDDDDDGDKGGT